MSRYIDFEIAREYLHKACDGLGGNGGLMLKIKFDQEPAADVVEVVRCKDCMWNYIHVTPKGHDYHICRLLNLAFDNNDDFFCAYGERREDARNDNP